jgi:hypothetical protein
MATEQLPLLFFRPSPNTDPLAVAAALQADSPSPPVAPLDPDRTLKAIKATRGFARLEITPPTFSLDNPRIGAALDGMTSESLLSVRFFGDFEKLAEPLFHALATDGLACYSVWDKQILTTWPKSQEIEIDSGFAARMARVIERKTLQFREAEPDADRRTKILSAFVNSPEFRAEMAREARSEQPGGTRRKKPYADVVNCYGRWRYGRPSASELAAVRKLAPRYAAMGMTELRNLIGTSPRLLLLTAAAPDQAATLRESADRNGLIVDIEPP